MTKIKNLLFKDKKRKVITICSLVLAIIILLFAILIPTISNMNKHFASEKELFEHIQGTYSRTISIESRYIVKNSQIIHITKSDFSDFVKNYLLETKDISATKNLELEMCEDLLLSKYGEVIKTECSPKKGIITIYPQGFEDGVKINVKKDGLVSQNEKFGLSKHSGETQISKDKYCIDFFNEAKKTGFKTEEFLPTSKEFDQRLIDANLNTLFSMNYLKGLYQKTKELTISNTQYVGFDRMFDVIYQYMKDIPGFSENAKSEILAEIRKGEVRDALKGTVLESKFTLYGVDFHVYYKSLAYPKNVYYTGYEAYTIMMKPGTISLG